MDIVPIEAGTLLKSPDKIVLIIWILKFKFLHVEA